MIIPDEVKEKYKDKLTPEGVFKNRNIFHYSMAPAELFPCCGGRGFVYKEDGEEFCTCLAGNMRRELESPGR